MIVVNIVLSYLLWSILSLLIYGRIKNINIYLLFPLLLYSIPVVYMVISGKSMLSLVSITTSLLALVYFNKTKYTPLKSIITPLPLILCIIAMNTVY